MAFKQGNTIALCGAFYNGDSRIGDLSPYAVKCRLFDIEHRPLAVLDDKVRAAEDGSVCVILDPEDTKDLMGRVLYSFILVDGDNIICQITKDFDIYE